MRQSLSVFRELGLGHDLAEPIIADYLRVLRRSATKGQRVQRAEIMKMSGEYRIPAPRQAVWDALIDPEILKFCIPGCEEMVKNGENAFDAKVVAKVGPVRAKFGGTVELTDIDAPNGCRITGQGQGGAAGFAKGAATVQLAEEGGGTILSYSVDATVGGKLAQIGSRLIDATAKKMADDFFSRFAETVAGPAGAERVAAPQAEAAPAAGKLLPARLWVGGLVALVIIILLVFAFM